MFHCSFFFFLLQNKDLKGTFTHLFFLALCLWNQLQVSVTLDLCSKEGKFVRAVRHRKRCQKKKKNPTGGWKISSQLNLLHTSAFQSVTNPARVKTLPLSEPQLCFAGPTGLIRGISEPLGGSEAAFQGHWCRAPFVELDAVQIAPTQSSILYRKGEKRKEEVLSL